LAANGFVFSSWFLIAKTKNESPKTSSVCDSASVSEAKNLSKTELVDMLAPLDDAGKGTARWISKTN
jgi:hypothetical protein